MADDRTARIEHSIRIASDNLVFSYGAKGWNMDSCAADAGITKRTLYRYRESKARILEDVLLRFISSTQEELVRTLDGASDIQEGLQALLTVFPDLIQRLDSRLIRDIFLQYPSVEAKVVQQRQSLTEEIAARIGKARDDGHLRPDTDPVRIVEIIQAMVLYYLKSDPDELEDRLRQGLYIVLNGLLAETQS